jgi:excinuclease ABC subunit A
MAVSERTMPCVARRPCGALEVDHTPIGKTPRSNPATYAGFYDDIRRLLAQTPEARLRAMRPVVFVQCCLRRCEACGGQGQRKVEMNFCRMCLCPVKLVTAGVLPKRP